jgi:hypothetical protein
MREGMCRVFWLQVGVLAALLAGCTGDAWPPEDPIPVPAPEVPASDGLLGCP